MGLRWIYIALVGMGLFQMGHSENSLWLIEQEFVKFGKKEAYEEYKKQQQNHFVRQLNVPRYALEDIDSSQYIYLIPVRDFKGLNTLMRKRMDFHKELTEHDVRQLLPFLSTVNFFMESLHYQLPECSFTPAGKQGVLDYAATYYTIYGIIPGNGPIFEERLKSIAQAQKTSSNPICFRTWRVLFGGDTPSYIVAVFSDTVKEAKKLARDLEIIDGQMKNVLRQEKKGSGVIRKDLSAMDEKNY